MSGDTTVQERVDFLDWLDKSKIKSDDPWMQKIWEDSSKNENIVLGAKEKILHHILDRIADGSNPSIVNKKILNQKVLSPNRNIWKFNYSLRYASIILIILIPLIFYKSMIAKIPISPQIQHDEKLTHNGQHLTFRLEDGSQITLNSNSRLSYPIQFTDTSRIVTLNGEAYFDVAKDAKRPFTVITGNVSTTALGTSFNICYPEDQSLSKISLLSGAVKVEMKNRTGNIHDVELIPGEQLLYGFMDESFEIELFDPLAISGWKDGIIYFKEAGIDEIVERLEVWYDVEIKLTGNLAKKEHDIWNYSGQFEKESLENVLRGISYVKNFSFEIDDKNIELMFN